MKTTWNLELLYKDGKDPKIEKDIRAYEKQCADFEKKYRENQGYQKSETKLLEALRDYEVLAGSATGTKPLMYFYYRKDLNAADQEAEANLNKIEQRLTKAGNKVIFFDLALGKISKDLQKKFLESKKLSHYTYHLKRVFDTAQYDLSEAEEKILNLKSQTSRGMWVDGQEKLLNQQMVTFKGKEMPLPEAYNKLSQLPVADRRKLADACHIILKNISYFAESEINAIMTDKKINDELRGLKKPYSATILRYHNDEKSIENLVSTVTKNFHISHKFYEVKAKMLKLDHFEYADRAAKVGDMSTKLEFKDSVEIVRKAFGKANPRYLEILNGYLEKGQIDVYPKKGKRGGAYCSSNIALPTYVMLNQVDNFNSLKTFGHEMGHAIHSELSKSQTPIYQHYPISIAEVASTLFENFVFDEVFPTLNAKEKVIALHDRINDAISTIFRQIACFNFELELHETIRKEGAISKENIAALHNKHMGAYLGPAFKMKETDGYFFVEWPHIRSFFYVYSYAYGEIISKALYNKYTEDPAYIKEIEKFLSAGSSASPETIFKKIGLDTSKASFFEAGLKAIEEDIKELDRLVS